MEGSIILNLKDKNDPFKMRECETIVDLDKYVKHLEIYGIKYTKEQYDKAKKLIECKGCFN